MLVCRDQDLNGDRDARRMMRLEILLFSQSIRQVRFSTFFQKILNGSGPNPERTVQAVAVPYSALRLSSRITILGTAASLCDGLYLPSLCSACLARRIVDYR